eukprot:GEZU01001185.1.p1 GENE.GEZU01001185.1~~GEZU01001185.1.p1  ORF type:complete len:294 (-),score=62.47 GEZU01001185.1:114-995(-)
MAVYYHYKLTGDASFVKSIQQGIQQIEDFLLDNVEYSGFLPPDYSIWEESSNGLTGQPLPPSYFTFTQALGSAGLWCASQLEQMVFGDQGRSQQVLTRAEQIQDAIEQVLWMEDVGYYARGVVSTTLELDTRVDSSSVAVIWAGVTNDVQHMQSHLANVNKNLTRLEHGIARYWGDPFFFDSLYNPGGQEVGAASPPWGVVTMMTAWAESVAALAQNGNKKSSTPLPPIVSDRLQWMVDRAAPGGMPVGEAIDGVTGAFVMSSCPDLYEYAGVYLWTVLMEQQLSSLPNPHLW